MGEQTDDGMCGLTAVSVMVDLHVVNSQVIAGPSITGPSSTFWEVEEHSWAIFRWRTVSRASADSLDCAAPRWSMRFVRSRMRRHRTNYVVYTDA